MSDILDAAGAVSDDDLERRLRTTYTALARSTRLERAALDQRAVRPTWSRQRPLRLAVVAAAVVLLAGLGVIATRRGDDGATGAADGPPWALVTPGTGWQYLGVEPYDPLVDGLGPQVGEVIRFGRDDAVLRVMSLRDAVGVGDRLVADELDGAPPVFATPDGRVAVRDLRDGVTLVLALEGEVDAASRPDLVGLARQAVTVDEDAWRRLQERQGFATLGRGGRGTDTVFRFDDGLEVERSVTGSLRGGVSLVYSSGVVGFGGTPTADEDTGVVVASVTDRPSTVRATADVRSVDIDGMAVTLHPIVDPDSGVTVRWGTVELEPGTYEVVGRDAAGAVVFQERTQVEAFDEVTP